MFCRVITRVLYAEKSSKRLNAHQAVQRSHAHTVRGNGGGLMTSPALLENTRQDDDERFESNRDAGFAVGGDLSLSLQIQDKRIANDPSSHSI